MLSLPLLGRYRRLRAGNSLDGPNFGSGLLALYRSELLVGNDYPYSTMGKVFTHGGSGFNLIDQGSGVMVGPNIVLTSAHLVPWEIDPWGMYFVPAFRAGTEPFGGSWVK